MPWRSRSSRATAPSATSRRGFTRQTRSEPPLTDRSHILSRLKSVGRLDDSAIDLAKAALLLAALDFPDLDLGHSLDYLTSLDRDMADEGATAASLLDRRRALR